MPLMYPSIRNMAIPNNSLSLSSILRYSFSSLTSPHSTATAATTSSHLPSLRIITAYASYKYHLHGRAHPIHNHSSRPFFDIPQPGKYRPSNPATNSTSHAQQTKTTTTTTRPLPSATNASTVTSASAPVTERVHFEKRLVDFTPQQLYDVVIDIDNYKNFVPWCTDSRIIDRTTIQLHQSPIQSTTSSPSRQNTKQQPGTSSTSSTPPTERIRAVLNIGFQNFNEAYTSLIHAQSNTCVMVEADQNDPASNLFKTLKTTWEFSKGPFPGSSWVTLRIVFEFKNSVYQMASNLFFEKVVKNMIKAFTQRCHVVYKK